ncbi:MAG TPA: type VI secretion system lipoprotein TssJ [Gammaproteobacteria bacterium]|nr:type VI secretion system lipoprotein TssJ [Gammaproteobacteria bacterium]
MNSKKIAVIIFSCFLSSCSFSSIKLDITAQKHLNRDAYYGALPVVVRVYTLKNPEGFSDATFRELWHDDKKVLGENLVSRQEYTVVPGTTLHVSIPKQSSAQYLGAVALFRHPYHNQWRVITPMPWWFSTLTLSGNRITS